MDGRPLREALAEGPDEEQVTLDTRTLRVRNGPYRAVLQVSEVEGKRPTQTTCTVQQRASTGAAH